MSEKSKVVLETTATVNDIGCLYPFFHWDRPDGNVTYSGGFLKYLFPYVGKTFKITMEEIVE